MKQSLRVKTRQFLEKHIDSYEDLVGVDLTMKQMADGKKLDSSRASENFRHYLNILNKKVYGNASKRFGKRLFVIPVIEVKNHRYHYHTIFKLPKWMGREEFCELAITCWQKTYFGYREFYFKPIINERLVRYITKFKADKDELDWINLSLDF